VPSQPSPPPVPLPAAKRNGLLDEPQATSFLADLIEANGVIELRLLDAKTASDGWGSRPKTHSGFFDNKEAAVNALMPFSGWKGAYATLNPVLPDLLARASNRLVADESTKDHEVTHRTHLLLDVDPVRPTGISSTDEEHEAAVQRARDVADYLSGEASWPEPVLIDSGNGAHLRYAIDLPREDSGLVQRVLQAISSLFSDERLTVDTSVHNPSRIARLPGTLACKGDSTADRPHRMAMVLSAPEHAEVVPQERLEQIAAFSVEGQDDRQKPEDSRSPGPTSRATFDVPAFLQRHGIGVRKQDPWRGGSRWVLEASPLCSSHGPDTAAYIVQFPSGALAAGCHHESCAWEWRDLRGHFEPESQRPGARSAAPRQGAGIGIRPGCVVRAADRDNYGTVSSVSSDRGTAFVNFESRDGHSANVELPLEQLTVTSGGSASRSILASPRQYEFYDLAALLGAKPPNALVTGILDEGNVAVLYGAPASFKSFVALDLALTLTTGTVWKRAAHETQECNVVLFSGEGQAGLGRRILAWLSCREEELRAAGVDPSGLREVVQRRFRAAGEAIPLIDASEPETVMAALEELTKDLDGSPKLIVLDTLARCFLGGDENSARDMGTFIEACDEIRKRTGAAVLLVHHTGKDGDLERGSSALRAGADVMIKAEREDDGSKDGGQVVLTFEKRKDGPGAEDMVIDLHPVRFEDADGESHSSLAAGLEVGRAAVVRSADTRGRGRRQKRSTPAEHQRLEILHCLANVFDLERATANKLKECTGIPRSSVQKQLAVLRKDGRVEITPDGRTFIYTITDKGRESLSPTSPSSSESETKGGRLPSPTSPPHPLRGGGDDTETETRATDGECDG
jgi:DNA-binding transcriptional ArsR family regulator